MNIRAPFALALGFLLLGLGQLTAGTPEEMKFNGLVFKKAFSDTSSAGPFSEYLPKGQSLDSWTKLMGFYYFPALRDPKDAAQTLARVVKEQNPDAQSGVIYNETTNEAVVDFVTWPQDQSDVEFNVWKYKKNPDGKGLIALQYAERAYSDFEPFFKKLATRRVALRDAMAGFTP